MYRLFVVFLGCTGILPLSLNAADDDPRVFATIDVNGVDLLQAAQAVDRAFANRSAHAQLPESRVHGPYLIVYALPKDVQLIRKIVNQHREQTTTPNRTVLNANRGSSSIQLVAPVGAIRKKRESTPAHIDSSDSQNKRPAQLGPVRVVLSPNETPPRPRSFPAPQRPIRVVPIPGTQILLIRGSGW